MTAFPPHIIDALDRLNPPPLPDGFTQRLIARIEAGDLPAPIKEDDQPLPIPRRHTRGVWHRSGRLMIAATMLGIASATAAASGVFGEPIYVPVVSETLAKAKLVELPVRIAAAAKKENPQIASALPAPDVGTGAAADPAKARQALHDLRLRLRADPEFRRLPPDQRRAFARQEVRAMVERGELSIDDLKANVAENRAQRSALIEAQRDASAEGQPDIEGQLAPRLETQPRPLADPEKIAARQAAWRSLSAEDRARLRQLRALLRDAPPADRPAIRREMRRIWLNTQAPADSAVAKPDAVPPEMPDPKPKGTQP